MVTAICGGSMKSYQACLSSQFSALENELFLLNGIQILRLKAVFASERSGGTSNADEIGQALTDLKLDVLAHHHYHDRKVLEVNALPLWYVPRRTFGPLPTLTVGRITQSFRWRSGFELTNLFKKIYYTFLGLYH